MPKMRVFCWKLKLKKWSTTTFLSVIILVLVYLKLEQRQSDTQQIYRQIMDNQNGDEVAPPDAVEIKLDLAYEPIEFKVGDNTGESASLADQRAQTVYSEADRSQLGAGQVPQQNLLPSQQYNPPPQGNSVPSQGSILPVQGIASQGNIPVQQGNIPVQQGNIPVQQGNIPVQQGNILVQQGNIQEPQGNIPVPQGINPSADENVLPSQGNNLLPQSNIPQQNEYPPIQQNGPQSQENAPPQQGNVLQVQENNPPLQYNAPLQDGIPESQAPEYNAPETSKKLKTILMWNPFFKNEDYYFGIGQEPFIRNQCKVDTCQTTRDHRFLDTADAVLIHGPRVDEAMPPYRPPGQLYTYLQAEPHYNGSMTYLPGMNNMFNITITNRRDSDIHLQYGIVEPSKTAAKTRGNKFVSPLDKPKAVVWPVSHCNTPGRRERYVKELEKHIQVDIYGACGPLVCPKSDECMERFEGEYKFYLSLENHYCRDYVTEKLYRTLEYDMIPIVFGGANYFLDAPPHSVINILDYPHPKDLATYLNYLSQNETAYNEYFEWKKHYVIEHYRHVIFGQAFCKLCKILHDPTYDYKDFRDLYSWWVDGMCDANVIGRMARKYKWFE